MNDESYTRLLLIFANAVFVLTVVVVGRLLYVTARNRTKHRLQIQELALEHEKKLVTATLNMKELTFQEIAQEIHDNVKQTLILSKLNLHNLHSAAGNDKEQMLNDSIRYIEKALDDLGNLSQSLNTDWIKGIGLVSAIQTELQKLRYAGRFTIETEISQNHTVMDADRELILFRIVQEVLSNIIKHSAAKRILFSLQYGNEKIDCTISDDGKGFDAANTTGHGTGLINLKRRAQALNARLTIDTAPGKGTKVSLSVPYKADADPQDDSSLAADVKATPSFNLFQRILIIHSHPSILMICTPGYAVWGLFLSAQLLWPSLIAFSLLCACFAFAARKKNFDRLVKDVDVKRLYFMLNPLNLTLLLLINVVIIYGLWIDNMSVLFLAAIPATAYVINFSLYDRNAKRTAR